MKKRIVIGLTVILLIFFFGGLVIFFTLETSRSQFRRLIMLHQAQIFRNNLLLNAERVQRDIYLYRFHRSHEVKYGATIDQDMIFLESSVNLCFTCHHTEFILGKILEAKRMIGEYKTQITRITTSMDSPSGIEQTEDRTIAFGNHMLSIFNELVTTANVNLSKKTVEGYRYVNSVEMTLYSSLLLCLFIAVFIAIRFEKQLMKPIGEILKGADHFSVGDLSYRIPENMPKELSLVAKSFNKMTSQLKENIDRIKKTEQSELMREIAAGLAHEIKNPLTGIRGALEVFMHELNLSREEKAVFEEMLFQIKKLDVMTKSFLEYARPPSPQIVPTNINDIIHNTVFFASKQNLHKNMQKVAVIENLDRSLPALPVDPVQVQQVILNLMFNAMDAMPDGGTLTFATSHRDGYAEIAVSDTGHGMNDETMDKIFKPFFTTKTKGIGIGLSICKRLIEQHNGEISVSSNESGTTFSVMLPRG
ncbi:MAG: ATP-binding protein [Thermodesulfovibrionales bacterium]